MRRSYAFGAVVLFILATAFSGLVAQTPKPVNNAGENVLVKVEKPIAAPESYRTGFSVITARDSRVLLSYLSSDLLEGRESGSRGYRLAAEYAASLFALWGLEPAGDAGNGAGRDYLQEVVMKEYTGLGCTATWSAREGESSGGRTFHEGVDLENYYRNRIPEVVSAPVVFAGYGLSEPSAAYDDFAGLELKGKIVMLLDDVPGRGNPASPFAKGEAGEKPRAVIWFDGLKKANAAAARGARAVLVVRNSLSAGDVYAEMGPPAPNDARPILHEPSRLVTLPGAKRDGGAIFISREMADFILASSGRTIASLKAEIESRWKPASFEIPGGALTIRNSAESERILRCYNVIGVIPGSDPRLKNEAVVIGAHLDHLGQRGDYIFNGADDNGSGVTGTLEMARAVASLPRKPKRSMVFCLWTGEELGLLGSAFYLQHPVFPPAQTVAYLNLDMIGRSPDDSSFKARLKRLKVPAEAQSRIAADNFAVVAFPAGQGLGEILSRADQAVGLDLWPQAEAIAKTSGLVSDYASFAEARVPYLSWMGGTHEDYHQTSDSLDKINLERMAKIIRLTYLSALTLADQ
ncbi:MAG: M20/M25/M40 family metallo-hydrolase [Candidatus Aminicenantes bacterium]|nr:M20/M25/M40 family metallo-hydrolase [Candidatus Aminicenantes bacterium]